MRVTQFMLYDQAARYLLKNLERLSIHHNRLSTGKKIDKPSDDIIGATRAMDYRLSISHYDQYIRNINEATSQLSFTKGIIQSTSEALIRLKELAIQGVDGALNEKDRVSTAKEVERLRDHLFSLANSKFRDRYIFSGFRTDLPSFDSDFNYRGDEGIMNVMIDRDVAISINVPGSNAFYYNNESFMKIADNLSRGLTNNDITAIRESLDKINGAFDRVNTVLADIGARLNRLDDQINRLKDANIDLRFYLSSAEDTDFVETVSEVSKIELALQAFRQTVSKTLSQSLFDFLR